MHQPPRADHLRLQRFERMGLTGNPFRVLAREALAEVYVAPEGSGARADAIVASAASVIQIIAPRGWGKSMLLAAVQAKLAAVPTQCHYLYCPPEEAVRFTPPGAKVEAVLLDEAQRLRPRCLRRARRWCERSGGRIIAATHDDLTAHFGSQTRTVRLPRADAAMIARLFARRVAAAGGDPTRIRLGEGAAGWLTRRAAGNLRWIEALCYEAFQSVEAAEGVTIDVPTLEQLRFAVDPQ
jgi:hypothetical protein